MCWDDAWDEAAWFTWFRRDLGAREAEPTRSALRSEAQAAVDEAMALLRGRQGRPLEGSPKFAAPSGFSALSDRRVNFPSLLDIVKRFCGRRSESPEPEEEPLQALPHPGRR